MRGVARGGAVREVARGGAVRGVARGGAVRGVARGGAVRGVSRGGSDAIKYKPYGRFNQCRNLDFRSDGQRSASTFAVFFLLICYAVGFDFSVAASVIRFVVVENIQGTLAEVKTFIAKVCGWFGVGRANLILENFAAWRALQFRVESFIALHFDSSAPSIARRC